MNYVSIVVVAAAVTASACQFETQDDSIGLDQQSRLFALDGDDVPADAADPDDVPAEEEELSDEEYADQICDEAVILVFVGTGICCQNMNGLAWGCMPVTPDNVYNRESFCPDGTVRCGDGHDPVECRPAVEPGECSDIQCLPGGGVDVGGCNQDDGFLPIYFNGRCRCVQRPTFDIVAECLRVDPEMIEPLPVCVSAEP